MEDDTFERDYLAADEQLDIHNDNLDIINDNHSGQCQRDYDSPALRQPAKGCQLSALVHRAGWYIWSVVQMGTFEIAIMLLCGGGTGNIDFGHILFPFFRCSESPNTFILD